MGWDQMANKLIDVICTPAAADQIKNSSLDSKAKITIAKRYAEENDKTDEFWAIFKNAITADEDAEDIYRDIAKLGVIFITTNCDDLLVMHFRNSFTTECTKENLDKQFESSREFVFCIHGYYGTGTEADKKSLVFTVDEYLQKYSNGSPLLEFLSTAMHDKCVLFLGYGLNEFQIISRAFEIGEDIVPKHYILEGFFKYQQELAEAEAAYYRSLGVELIPYCKDEKGFDQQRVILKKWIEQLSSETPYISRGVNRIVDVLRASADELFDVIDNYMSGDDKNRSIFLETLLDEIPHKSNRFIMSYMRK